MPRALRQMPVLPCFSYNFPYFPLIFPLLRLPVLLHLLLLPFVPLLSYFNRFLFFHIRLDFCSPPPLPPAFPLHILSFFSLFSSTSLILFSLFFPSFLYFSYPSFTSHPLPPLFPPPFSPLLFLIPSFPHSIIPSPLPYSSFIPHMFAHVFVPVGVGLILGRVIDGDKGY